MPAELDLPKAARELAELQAKAQRVAARAAALQPVAVGESPRQVLAHWDGVTLYHYTGTPAPARRLPLLVVYSLVNRPYILDLKPERSLLGALRDAGSEVHLLDWGYPEPADRYLELEDYVEGYLHDAVELLCRRYQVEQVQLLGVCQGGTLSVCYAALNPERVRSLITLVTPIDFHAGSSALYHLAKHMDFQRLAEGAGNVSADLLNTVFVGLKPYRILTQRYLEMLEIEDEEALRDFLRMERWMYDSPDQAGVAFAQFARDFYQRNGLVRGQIELAGRPVRLSEIRMPVFNVYANADHLVPPASALALGKHAGSNHYRFEGFDGGHLSVFISGRAKKRLFPELAKWLEQWDPAAAQHRK